MDEKKSISVGDHVYVWRCGYLYQHHGVIFTSDADDTMSVAEFYPDTNVNGDDASAPKIRITSLDEFSKQSTVYKVEYAASWHSRLFHRPGTTTSTPKDPLPLILSRLQFIVDNQDDIPPYSLSSNDECICVWISTGNYCTLQVCSILQLLSIGNAKFAVTTAAAASVATVTVPASGFWGFFGATTAVPLLTSNPLILPALIGMGLISLVPLEMLRRFQKKWKDTSIELNSNLQQHLEQNTEECGIYQLPIPPNNAFLHESSEVEPSNDKDNAEESKNTDETKNENEQMSNAINTNCNDSNGIEYSIDNTQLGKPNGKKYEMASEDNQYQSQIILDLITS